MSMVSLLKTKLHQRSSGEADKTQTDREEIPDVPSASALDRGMPIEVMRDFDTVLFYGKLAAASAEMLDVRRVPGEKCFPICQLKSAVLVRGYDARMNPILLLAKVIDSTGIQCMVGELKRIPHVTQRKSVRFPLTPPTVVYALEDTAPDQPQQCQLLNISTGGACIVTEHPYAVKQSLRLWVELARESGHTAVYHCRVVRATPRSGGCFEYGLVFTKMDKDSRGDLARDIQAIREENGKKLRS